MLKHITLWRMKIPYSLMSFSLQLRFGPSFLLFNIIIDRYDDSILKTEIFKPSVINYYFTLLLLLFTNKCYLELARVYLTSERFIERSRDGENSLL